MVEDRRTTDEDHSWFRTAQSGLLESAFNTKYSEVVTSERLIFGDFMVPGADPKLCNQIADMPRLAKVRRHKMVRMIGFYRKNSKHVGSLQTLNPGAISAAAEFASPPASSPVAPTPHVVEEYLEDYNSVSNAPMKLVVLLDAIKHVSRVTRVIRRIRRVWTRVWNGWGRDSGYRVRLCRLTCGV